MVQQILARLHLHFTFLLLLICHCAQTQSPTHFRIKKLKKGIYAAISKTGGYAICNAGIIDLGSETLIFDPFMVPEAAVELKREAERLTGHPVRYVVLSHFHNDHIGGTDVFRGASILSTTRTKELMQQNLPQQIAYFKQTAPKNLLNYKKQLTEAGTDFQKTEATLWTAYYEAIAKSYDSIRIIYPTETFENTKIIKGTKRTIQLLSFGAAHTQSDCIIYVPKEKIVFCGDVLFTNRHPWLGDGNPDRWQTYLEQLKKLPVSKFVPGHGITGTKKDLDKMILYLNHIHQTANDFVQLQKSPSDSIPSLESSPFKTWHLAEFYLPNLMFEYKRINETQQGKLNEH